MARPLRTMDPMTAKAIQSPLAALGWYPGAIDGDPGPKTEAAMIAFKGAVGFRRRLRFTDKTLARLFASNAPKAKGANAAAKVARSAELPWMVEVARVMGWHEDRNHASLKAWLKAGVVALDPRKQPWCGDGVDTAFARGLPGEPLNPRGASARSWETWGVGLDGPVYGCVVTFWRGKGRHDWRGHVGFVVGIIRDARGRVVKIVVRGANQDNQWSDRTFSVAKVTSYRWPSTFPLPKAARGPFVASAPAAGSVV